MFTLILALASADSSAERSFPTASFDAIVLATKATVRVEQSLTTSVTASGDPRLVRCVTIDVRGNRLILGWAGRRGASNRDSTTGADIVVTARTDCPHESNPQRLLIRVAAPRIGEVALRDLGAVQVSPMNVPKFTASIFARGAITIKGLRADATRLSVPGAGRISATGDLGQLDVAMGGQGAIDTRTANARSVNVSLAGKGVIAVSVDGPASGNLAGAGTVAVGGNPVCAIRNSGRGRIICPAAL